MYVRLVIYEMPKKSRVFQGRNSDRNSGPNSKPFSGRCPSLVEGCRKNCYIRMYETELRLTDCKCYCYVASCNEVRAGQVKVRVKKGTMEYPMSIFDSFPDVLNM
jgi:hypothetical protein